MERTASEIREIKKAVKKGMPLSKIAEKYSIGLATIYKLTGLVAHGRESKYADNLEQAKDTMLRTKKMWNWIKIGQAVSLAIKEEKKINWHDGIVISKNKHCLAIKCNNRTETITFAELLGSISNKIPLIRTRRGVESTEVSK